MIMEYYDNSLSDKEALAIGNKAKGEGDIDKGLSDEATIAYVRANIELASWGVDRRGNIHIQSYKLKGLPTRVFWGPDAAHGSEGKLFQDDMEEDEKNPATGVKECYQGG